MTNWINVISITDFPNNSFQVVDTDKVSVLVFNVEGSFYAIENVCTHDGGTLSDGCLMGDEIICPRHGARFCVKTGAVTAPPAYENVITFPVRVENGILQVEI
jgi:3-phenylpropionate/trans-cinnamate dioxygenase ferredoxin subunit